MSQPLFVATLDTRHFEFISLDVTEDTARDTLMKGWAAHCKVTDANPDHIIPQDVAVVEIHIGQCLRDRDVELVPPAVSNTEEVQEVPPVSLQETVRDYLAKYQGENAGPFVVCELICQKPHVSIHFDEDAAMAHAVACAMENLYDGDKPENPDYRRESEDSFRETLKQYTNVCEGDYEVHILTPTN